METYQILLFLLWIETFHVNFTFVLLRQNFSDLSFLIYFYLNNLSFQSFYYHSENIKT